MHLIESISLPTRYGLFTLMAFAEKPEERMPILVLKSTKTDVENPVLLRIHSECLTGDLLGSYRCDCGEQLHTSLSRIGEEGGVLIYLRQEGRGIGLINKMKAYQLQDDGIDTAEANIHLGFEPDERSYTDAVEILKKLGIHKVVLLTNNPEKQKALDEAEDIQVTAREPLIIGSRHENEHYLQTKRDFFGHWL